MQNHDLTLFEWYYVFTERFPGCLVLLPLAWILNLTPEGVYRRRYTLFEKCSDWLVELGPNGLAISALDGPGRPGSTCGRTVSYDGAGQTVSEEAGTLIGARVAQDSWRAERLGRSGSSSWVPLPSCVSNQKGVALRWPLGRRILCRGPG